VSEVLVALVSAFLGFAVGWFACNWHWHTRLAESWSELRVATWRRMNRKKQVTPERALDVGDVTDAFSYGLVAETEPEAGTRQKLATEQTRGPVPERRDTVT
jgi:hypothetical protein